MNNWTWDNPHRRKKLKLQFGAASALSQQTPPAPGFIMDERTGLLLPEGVKARPVKIGFQPK